MRAGLSLGGGGCLSLELVRELLGVRVQQVAHFVSPRRLRAAYPDRAPSALTLSRKDFSPLISTLLVRSSATTFTGAPPSPPAPPAPLIELVDGAHDLRRARVVQRNDLDRLIAALVHALDDPHDAGARCWPDRR